ncbi:MAG TPA: galactokinase family protein [Gemmatimonadales bacterium]|nr:galactokinase family protein [Gemmatimonadales bacterium]
MPHDALVEAATASLASLTGAASETRPLFVPGRLEVLGKHTDYAGGRSLLCAAERGVCFAARPRIDAQVRVVDAASKETADFTIGPALRRAPGHWANFPMTVARRIARNFPGPLTGADIAFASDLPPAAGMSSSSALIVGFFTVLADVNRLERRHEYLENIHSLEELAGYLGAIENGRTLGSLRGDAGVGTAGGSEDHTAILCCRADALSQYAFCPIRHERTLPLSGGWTFAIGVSGVVADKNGPAQQSYNRAARTVDAIMEAWRAATGRSDLWLADAVASAPDAPERMREILRAAATEPEPLLARLEQFVAESTEIVPEAGDCLARGDVEGIGVLVDRSQLGAERWLGNQVPETVALARSARMLGAAAASAFGAGFGGAVWALVRTAEADDFLERWGREYRSAFPAREPHSRFFLTRPGSRTQRL